jgi:DNA replication protein DnaC
MLINHTLETLHSLRLAGMAAALSDQLEHPDRYGELEFTARLGLLVDREVQDRDNRRLTRNLKTAHLRAQASIEDIDFRRPRGLDRTQILSLAQGGWVSDHRDLLISGATGCGKTTWPARWPKPRSAAATARSTGGCPGYSTSYAWPTPTAEPPS